MESDEAPRAIGPYSQAVKAGDFLFCSGQIPIDPRTGQVVEGGIREQTEQVLKNIEGVLKAAGADLGSVVRCEVFLEDMNHFSEMNEVYEEMFTTDPRPARLAVEVSRLPKDVLVEMSCIAYLG